MIQTVEFFCKVASDETNLAPGKGDPQQRYAHSSVARRYAVTANSVQEGDDGESSKVIRLVPNCNLSYSR